MNNFLNTQNLYAEPFNCNNGCEDASLCEFNNYPATNQYQPEIAYNFEHFTYANNNAEFTGSVVNCDDGVVPSNFNENKSYKMQCLQNEIYTGFNNNANGAKVSSFAGENESYSQEQSYTPCRGPRPWNFAECFGLYGDAPPCQYANVAVDMEDFM